MISRKHIDQFSEFNSAAGPRCICFGVENAYLSRSKRPIGSTEKTKPIHQVSYKKCGPIRDLTSLAQSIQS